MKKWMKKGMVGVAVATALAASPAFAAGGGNWTGAAGDGNWSNGANWSTASAPTTPSDPTTFNTGSGNITINGGMAKSITIDNAGGATGAYTFAGSGLTSIGGGSIVMNSNNTAAQTINVPLILTSMGGQQFYIRNNTALPVYAVTDGANTIFNKGTTNLNVGGGVTGQVTAGASGTITFDQAGVVSVTGNISESGGGKIALNLSKGAVNLTGNNSYSGGTIINNQIQVGVGSATAFGTGNVSLNTNVKLDNTSGAALALNNTFTISNNFNTLNVNNYGGSGNLTIAALDVTGNTTGNKVNVSVGKDSTFTINQVVGTGTVALGGKGDGTLAQGGGTMIIQNSANVGYSVQSGLLQVNNQTISLNGTMTTNQLSVTLATGGTAPSFQLGGLTLDLSAAALTDGQTWNIWGTGFNSATMLGSGFSVTGFTDAGGIWTMINGTDTWTFTQSSGLLSLSISAVPEPSTWTLMGIGAGLLFWVSYRRRKVAV